MQSQGAPNIQGDAFMTQYEIRTGTPNGAGNPDGTNDPDAIYDPANYYQYGVDMPAGATGGEVWIFDPGFCDTGTSLGLGENWNTSASLGYDPPQP